LPGATSLSVVLSLNRRRILIELGLGIAAVLDSLDSLRSIGLWVLVLGLVVAVAAYLVGKPTWFMHVIAWVRGVVRERPSGSDLEHFAAARYDYLRLGGVA
jgi:hypothetical protein